MGRTALTTGASSGFGLLTSIELAKRGWRVIATMRDLGRRALLEDAARTAGVLERIEVHALDVTNSAQIGALAKELSERPAPLDAVVNNAGFAVPGFTDDVTDAELRHQFDTNFFGAAAVRRALLPRFRRQGFGHIVMTSSVSGRMGFAGVGSYSASKFALEGWTECLRYEMKPLGIQVVLIEPGAFETDIWTRNAKLSAGLQSPSSPNAGRIENWRKRMTGEKMRPSPRPVVDLIAGVLENPQPKLRYVVGKDAKAGLLLRRILPWSLFERLIVKSAGLE
jgi:NAD(P)-dependent dehydrogenase (short-subunit alcohol dehydrogenase family)